ncbi:hypothetical protein PN462_02495 [Spirulina sp. CS-785/01]|nr:hypothetical protein [Spirulina sp. CS-785/01]MDB9311957.1 hypothetical protein [Spirulina sp. CS-785/01]
MSSPKARFLFHRKTLNNWLNNAQLPADFERKQEIIENWVKLLKNGTLDNIKETSLHGDFLKDIFTNILGYRSVIGGKGKA